MPSKKPHHYPDGDPCTRCGRFSYEHDEEMRSGPSGPSGDSSTYTIGIDGEGQGSEDHRYVMLAWSSEDRSVTDHVINRRGLSTEECLEFILQIPRKAKPFAFAFGYDTTMILKDLDSESLYRLLRPELRMSRKKKKNNRPRPVIWGDYRLNLMGAELTIGKKTGTRTDENGVERNIYESRSIWDIFKFYGSKFTAALKDWKIGKPEELEKMAEMKNKRNVFDSLSLDDIRKYCFDECAFMAEMARKLTEAHEMAGLPLKRYDGAGSTASAMLKILGIKTQKRDAPDAMRKPVAAAFFGGRFENSVLGEVQGPVWGYDISSAYPYQITFLPCLGCGSWRLTKKRQDLEHSTTALVQYRLNAPSKGRPIPPWGPYPFRLGKWAKDEQGSISFPSESGGGWVWKEEYLAGERLFPNVQFISAWVYETACRHQPFAYVPKWYVERLRIGKEGPGIVIKLGMNSCYGKLAQSVGNPIFQSWVWSGMTTSGCRAQILELMRLHKDLNNLLMVATDGIYTRERLKTPIPRDTQTGGPSVFNDKGKPANKPLGGWEEKEWKKGVFMARPGIYLPLEPTEDEIASVRARGVGRGAMFENWRTVVQAVRDGKPEVAFPDLRQFVGAKRGIHPRGSEFIRGDQFAKWVPRPMVMSFDPKPKREHILPDGRMTLRRFPDHTSEPYSKGLSVKAKEAGRLIEYQIAVLEQPDGGDFSEFITMS